MLTLHNPFSIGARVKAEVTIHDEAASAYLIAGESATVEENLPDGTLRARSHQSGRMVLCYPGELKPE